MNRRQLLKRGATAAAVATLVSGVGYLAYTRLVPGSSVIYRVTRPDGEVLLLQVFDQEEFAYSVEVVVGSADGGYVFNVIDNDSPTLTGRLTCTVTDDRLTAADAAGRRYFVYHFGSRCLERYDNGTLRDVIDRPVGRIVGDPLWGRRLYD